MAPVMPVSALAAGEIDALVVNIRGVREVLREAVDADGASGGAAVEHSTGPEAADAYLRGKVRNFRIYDRALSATEAAGIAIPAATRVSGDTAARTGRKLTQWPTRFS